MKAAPAFDIVGLGICTVDHLLLVPQTPEYGAAIKAKSYLHQAGGLVASALVAATRLGATTKVIARIGDDDEGRFIKQDLESEKVDASQLLSEENTQSHLSIVLVDENTGERSFISRWATGSAISTQELNKADITNAKILYLDNATEATLEAAKWAKEAGLTVVLDPVCSFAEAKELLAYVDVPIIPERFALEWLANQPVENAVKTLYERGASIAVVTLGERGCVVCSDEGLKAYPAFPTEVIDTTGAGDAFHGAFMYGLLQNWELDYIVKVASAVGALNCRYLGGRTGLPNKQEVEAFLATMEA